MKKTGFGKSPFLRALQLCFYFPKILVLLRVVHVKEKKINFWELKKKNNKYTW